MTSALAVVGLTYDGTDIQLPDLQIFLEIVRGLAEPPTVRGDDTTVPALEGTVEGTRVNHMLPIELKGFVAADPAQTTPAGIQSSFAANRATVRALFAPNRARADLVATLESGTILSISARPLPSTLWTTIAASLVAEVSVLLEGSGDWAEL